MGRLRLTNSSTVIADLPVKVGWPLPITGRVGACSFTIPRRHAAFSSDYVNPAGGSAVELLDDGYGVWRGLTVPTKYSADGVDVTAYQPTMLLSGRFLPKDRTYTNVSPGFLFSRIIRETLGGIAPFQVAATVVEGGLPLVDEFAFTGQPCWDALGDLMGRCDTEVQFDPDTLTLGWGDALGTAQYTNTDLIGEANLFDAQVDVDPSQRVAEVISRLDGASDYVARDGGAAADGLPLQAVINAGVRGATRVRDAEAELARRARPVVTVRGRVGVGVDYQALREGMIVPRVVIPWAEFSGASYTCRVLERTRDDSAGAIGLNLEVLGETSATYRPRALGIEPNVIGGRPSRNLLRTIVTTRRAVERLRG